MNPLVQSLLGQLRGKNDGGFKLVSELMQSGGNPDAILKQMINNLNPEQKQQILNTAKGYGCPDKFLSHLQNMK